MAARTVSTPAAEPARTPSLQPVGVIAVVTTQSMPQQTDVEGGLAGPGGSHDRGEPAALEGHRDAVEGADLGLTRAVGLDRVHGLGGGHGGAADRRGGGGAGCRHGCCLNSWLGWDASGSSAGTGGRRPHRDDCTGGPTLSVAAASSAAGMVRTRRSRDRASGTAQQGTATAATNTATGRPATVARGPPVAAPRGIAPQRRKRLVAFIRASSGSGVAACRRLTALTFHIATPTDCTPRPPISHGSGAPAGRPSSRN